MTDKYAESTLKRAAQNMQESNEDLTDISEHRSNKRHKQQQNPNLERTVRTVLRVSISNNPIRAPVNVLLADCKDVDLLFHKVLVEGDIKESPSIKIGELSATITYSSRSHLIRRGNAND